MEKSNRGIGINFEEKAYAFLKELGFKEVKWLSKESMSTFDFLCSDGEKMFFGDAKFSTNGHSSLSYSQRNADFVVTNEGEKIIFLWKKDFKGKVSINKSQVEIDAKKEMNPKKEKEGLLRFSIIKLLRKNPNGILINGIAKELGETRYKISKEVYNLTGLGKLIIEKIGKGNYEVVKVK